MSELTIDDFMTEAGDGIDPLDSPAWIEEKRADWADVLATLPEIEPELSADELREQATEDAEVRSLVYKMRVRAKADEAFRLETSTTPEFISLHSLAEVEAWEAPRWIVPGLFVESSVALLAGAPGLGKSFVLLDLCLSIAAGVPFIGRDVQQARTLYVAGEGVSGLRNRIAAWRQAHEGVSIPADGFTLASSGVNLSDDRSVARLVNLVREQEIGVVVLDTLSQLASIESENDASQVATVLRNVQLIREANPGTLVVLVHHVNKGAGAVRGSSALRGNVDTVVVAKGSSSSFKLSTMSDDDGKQKDGEQVKIDGLSLVPMGPSVVVAHQTVPAAADYLKQSILDALGDGPMKRAQIIEAVKDAGINRGDRTVASALAALVEVGILESTRGTYRLAE